MISQHYQPLVLLTAISAVDRFIFHGFRALFVLFLVKSLLYSNPNSFVTYGFMMMLSYLTPVIGGIISDKYLEKRYTLFLGFLNYLIGSCVLVFSSNYFFIGVGFLLVGGGLIRPSIFPLFSEEVDRIQIKRDGSFIFLYAITNLGTLLGILGCSVLGECIDWVFSFLVMIVFSIIGILLTIPLLSKRWFSKEIISHLIIMTSVSTLIYLFFEHASPYQEVFIYLLFIAIILYSFTKVFIPDMKKGSEFKYYVYVLIVHMMFFIIYEQSGNVMVMFAETSMDRSVFFLQNKKLPTTFFQSLDPLFNLLIGLVVGYMSLRKLRKKGYLTPAMKLILGTLILGIGFLWLSKPGIFLNDLYVSPWLLVFSTLLFVVGEILCIPVGISLIMKHAPKENASFYIGFWSFFIGIAQFVSGKIAFQSFHIQDKNSTSTLETLNLFLGFFNNLFLLTLGSIILCLIGVRFFRIKLF